MNILSVRSMTNKILKTALSLFFLAVLFLCWSNSLSAQTRDAPVIHIDPTTHTFPPVFEGEQLSHTFTVFNKGTADLHIKDVTHS